MSRDYGAVKEYRDDPLSPSFQYQAAGSGSIEEQCDQIKSNIFQINNGANTIERALRCIGTDRDTTSTRDKIHETSTNTNKVIQATTRLIRNANTMRGNRQQKMQVDRLTSDFQESVSRFQTLQKKVMEKVKSTVKLGSQATRPKEPLLDTAEASDDHQALLLDDRVAQLQAKQVVIEDDLAMLREREERIQQLESDILDVNEIFRDLGAMVAEQGEILNDIEDHVEKACTNVESANKQLISAAGYQKKSRKKMCCLLVFFLVIIIIITIIIVVEVKK